MAHRAHRTRAGRDRRHDLVPLERGRRRHDPRRRTPSRRSAPPPRRGSRSTQIVLRANGTRTTRPLLRTIADFDLNPKRTEPDRVWDLDTNDGESPIRVVADRYYAMGEAYTRWTDGGRSERLGIELDLVTPKDKSSEDHPPGRDRRQQHRHPVREQQLRAHAPARSAADARRAHPRRRPRGLRPDRGDERGRARGPRDPRRAAARRAARRRAGAARQDGRGSPRRRSTSSSSPTSTTCGPPRTSPGSSDASPGNPVNPAVMVELAGPDGVDARSAMAWFDHESGDPKGKSGGPQVSLPRRLRVRAEDRARRPRSRVRRRRWPPLVDLRLLVRGADDRRGRRRRGPPASDARVPPQTEGRLSPPRGRGRLRVQGLQGREPRSPGSS